jgi:hypothetical protein
MTSAYGGLVGHGDPRSDCIRDIGGLSATGDQGDTSTLRAKRTNLNDRPFRAMGCRPMRVRRWLYSHSYCQPACRRLAGESGSPTIVAAGACYAESWPPWHLRQTSGLWEAHPMRRSGLSAWRAGLIDQLDVTDPPPTLVPHGRYNGWYDIGGRRLSLRCTGRAIPPWCLTTER